MTEASTEKLYAGKFKTLEEFEEAYKHSGKVNQINADLNRRIEEMTTIPDDYKVPDGINIENIVDIKMMAKNVGLSQSHFEKFAKTMHEKEVSSKENYEKSRKEINDDQYNVLTEYVNKNYPEKIAKKMIDEFVLNKDAREEALKHRDKLLNSKTPGIGTVPIVQPMDYSEVIKARDELQKQPHNLKLRERYLAATKAYAHSKGER